MYDPRQHLIVALDVSSAADAQRIVAAVGDSALTYKVGMQLFTAAGPDVVRDLVASGRRVFLDLKYHDIPTTVAAAVREAANLGVGMLTLHAGGGGKMLRAGTEAARGVNPKLMVLGVTVLTSMDDQDLEQVGVRNGVVDQVLSLAALALSSGCQGVVASALEASELRARLGEHFLIVAPGVRLAGKDHGDQRRVVTPAEAMTAGANYIVVGRPITAATNPANEARSILGQMTPAAGT
jgi:orotidine-5'-phosphate decarboxylase